MRARWLLTLLIPTLLTLLASPAAADPAGPTHYRSTVTEMTPQVDGLEVVVLGGDAYVTVTAPPGSTVEIAGYPPDAEPYLRIGPDGTVERNEASPARWINDGRFTTQPPPEASADAPPRWQVVADGGTYAWHDHRVHWMSPADPRHVDTSADEIQPVQTWELALAVDGEPVTVAGELVWIPGPTPVLPVAVVALVAALGVATVLRRHQAARWVAAVGVLPAAGVGLAASVGWPAGADTDPAWLILPALALALVVVAHLIRDRPGLGPPLLGALAGFPLLIWAVLWSRALVAPIVPTTLPDEVARLLIAAVLGVGITAVVAAGRQLVAPTVSTSGVRTGPTEA